jgi:hypothetical protein
MVDEFLALFENNDPINIISTPNIELHLDKKEFSEYFKNKFISGDHLFARSNFIEKLGNMFKSNCDLPIIIYGLPGIGKLITCIGLLNHLPLSLNNPINNLDYFKVYDHTYTKLLCLDTVFYLNLKIITSDSETIDYLKCINKISTTRSFNDEKRYFIIKGLDTVSQDIINFIKYMLDRLNALSSFIFIVNKLNVLPQKIITTCATLHYPHLNQQEFDTIFNYNYKNKLTTNDWLVSNKFYKIYENNQYNIGHTINQIRYLAISKNLNNAYFKNSDNLLSLDIIIVQNFIKNYLILSSIEKIGDIRKFIYTLLSINYPIITFVQNLTRLIIKSKLKHEQKSKIIEKFAYFSKIYKNANKEVIPLEGLLFNIIDIIYS